MIAILAAGRSHLHAQFLLAAPRHWPFMWATNFNRNSGHASHCLKAITNHSYSLFQLLVKMWPLTHSIHCLMPDSLDLNSGSDAVIPNLVNRLHPDTERSGSNTIPISVSTPTILIEVIHVFPQSLQENARIVLQVKSRPLHSRLFPIHRSLIILSLDAIQCPGRKGQYSGSS
jgi:hypothetical protein